MMVVVNAIVTTTMVVPGAFLAASVDVTALTGVKNLNLNQVKDERNACNRQHDRATDLVSSVDQSLGRFVEKPYSHYPYRKNGTESANNFHSMVSESVLTVCAPVCNL
jgi:hypothetical protein